MSNVLNNQQTLELVNNKLMKVADLTAEQEALLTDIMEMIEGEEDSLFSATRVMKSKWSIIRESVTTFNEKYLPVISGAECIVMKFQAGTEDEAERAYIRVHLINGVRFDLAMDVACVRHFSIEHRDKLDITSLVKVNLTDGEKVISRYIIDKLPSA